MCHAVKHKHKLPCENVLFHILSNFMYMRKPLTRCFPESVKRFLLVNCVPSKMSSGGLFH